MAEIGGVRMAERDRVPPGIAAIFLCFFSIGAQSFGGGLSAWIRRDVVQRRGWMEDGQFLAGLALSQIAPGPNAVNLAIFTGTVLRGSAGAAAALAGMLALPTLIVLAAGAAYFASARSGGGTPAWLDAALAGAGAGAIGMSFANGIRLTRRNVATLRAVATMVVTAVVIGLTSIRLPVALAVLIPASLLLNGGGKGRR